MSTLQNQITQSLEGLSDDSLSFILEMIQRFVMPAESKSILMLTPSVIFVFEKGLDMLELLAAACQQRLGGSGRRRSGRER